MQFSAQETIDAMDGVSEIIGRINASSGMITQAVDQQRLTSNEISSNIQQADGGVSNIAASIAEIVQGLPPLRSRRTDKSGASAAEQGGTNLRSFSSSALSGLIL